MSNESKHTPGPWKADLDGNFTLGGDCRSIDALTPDGTHVVREICSIMLDTDEHPDGAQWKEDVANAHLLAAAPDMESALEDILNRTKNIPESAFPSRAHFDAFVDACENGHTILTKARTGAK